MVVQETLDIAHRSVIYKFENNKWFIYIRIQFSVIRRFLLFFDRADSVNSLGRS